MLRRRRMFTGLRARMVAAFLVVALLSSVLASGIAYQLVRRAMLQRAQDGVLNEFKSTLSHMVPSRLPAGTDLQLNALRFALANDPDRSVYVTYGSSSTPLEMLTGATSTAPVRGPASRGDHVPISSAFLRRSLRRTVFQRVTYRGNPYMLVGTGMLSAEESGSTWIIVVLAVRMRSEQADLDTFTQAILLADGLAVVLALGLALMAARGVLLPVRRLARAARALGEGRLDSRVPVRGNDELADLARTFNSTAGVLEGTVAELRALEAASRRFVADVSHELRTPLTAMVAVTDLLAEESDAAGEGGAALRIVVEETDRLRRLVERLIEISRFDAGAAALVPDEIVVGEAVAATLEMRGWTDRVRVEGPGGLVARLDPRRFDVIVANLVGNALKHGEPPVRVEFGPVRPGAGSDNGSGSGTGSGTGPAGSRCDATAPREFELVVTDAGPGIPPDLLGAVFDRFVKADSARERSEGSGLGLSIALANAALHGGTLTAANAEADGADRADEADGADRTAGAGGAVFTLRLPIGAVSGHEDTVPAGERDGAAGRRVF